MVLQLARRWSTYCIPRQKRKQIYVGSQPRSTPVQLLGVPVFGIIDSSADMTIIGGCLFRNVATTARLRKSLEKARTHSLNL